MKLTHPETDRVIEVDESHAGPYLDQGWEPAAAAPAKKAAAAPADDNED